MSKEMRETVSKIITKNRTVKVTPEEVSNKQFVAVAKIYLNDYGYIPSEWESYMKKSLKNN